ncbi:HTH-type transcriptional regulator PrtR [compost metagenome]
MNLDNPTPEERLAEAKRLKDIYLECKRADPSLTQDRVADLCEWAGQSVVSQYMNGRIPLNLSALLKFSNVLKFDPQVVSPRLASFLTPPVIGRPATSITPIPDGRKVTDSLIPIEIWDDETPIGEDEVELPFFKEVELSAGKGSEVMLETNGRKLRFGKRSLQRKNIDPQSAACVPVSGNSMEPVLPDGSTVGVDLSATTIQDGKMYAIDHDGQLRVKLLYRLPGAGLRLRSYNADEHPDERYDGEYVAEHIRIIGRVFWYSVLL